MSAIASVCVFCGSKVGTDPAFAEETRRLGTILGEAGMRLVYGGGKVGLMGLLAQSVMDAGGEVTGVIPSFLIRLEVGNGAVTELIETDSMHGRKEKMFEIADGFVVIPGGLGTMDETFEILTWKQLRMHEKPIVVLDTKGYWQPFKALIDHIVAHDFAHPDVADLIQVVSTPEDVLPALRDAPTPTDEVLTSHL